MKRVKLHLGCGSRFLSGYIHIDLDSHPHIDYCHDINKLPMFDDESVDLIYSCGAIAYFDRQQVVSVLKEWRRALKPDGVLRISITDFESIIKVYFNYGNDLDGRGILGPLFGRWQIDGTSGKEVIYQKTVYDFRSLKKLLELEGFKNVKRYNWQEVMPPDYDDFSMAYIPHMDKENGTLIMLNVECQRD